MPRQVHGRPVTASSASAKKRNRGNAKSSRGLDAFEIAEQQFPSSVKIRQHRLGQAEDDDETPTTRADADERSSKRRKIETTSTQDDYAEEGSDPDGNTWHVGVDEDDDDSDLDSDDAFGASDEEKFADFTFRGSGGGRKSNKDNAGSDGETGDEDEDEDDLGDDAVDLATAWDMDDEDEQQNKKSNVKILPKKQIRNDSSESDADDESDLTGDDSDRMSEDEDEDVDPETSTRLRSFVDSLLPTQDNKSISAHKVRQSLPDKPSQFGLRSAGLSAAELMQYVKDPKQRKSLKIMQEAEQEDPSTHKDGVPGKLAAPLAKRQQDRLDRVAAYDVSKTTMNRWLDTVKQNRRAEHLSFPAANETKSSASAVKAFQPIFRSEPQTELEMQIQAIMHENGAAVPSEQQQSEDASDQESVPPEDGEYDVLPNRNDTVEEIKARQREKRMQRELMFREEVRAKRLKKIKSKAFRRVRRKEKDKQDAKMRDLGMLDTDEEREKNDRQRAEERMGARHRESKWAKGIKETGQAMWNEDARVGVVELARRDDELRQRIEGKTIHDSDSVASDSDDASDSQNEMQNWEEKMADQQNTAESGSKSKLAGMAFMQRAEAARKAANDTTVDQIRRSMQDGEGSDAGTDQSNDDADEGRQRFGNSQRNGHVPQAPLPTRNDFEEVLSEDEIEDDAPLQVPLPKTILEPVDSALPTEARPQPVPSSESKQQKQQSLNGHAAAKSTKKPAVTHTKKVAISKTKTLRQSNTDLGDYTSPSESDGDNDIDAAQDLALDIFAGEDERDLLRDFAKEKKDTVDEEGDQIIDSSLPGWGSWTGAGVSKKAQKNDKRFITVVKGVTPAARKDSKLDRVIINEKRVKKNGKYLATELPHPYESRAQYERALRLPMGPEWSTRSHYQDSIKPRLLLKQGTVIKPVAKPTA